MRLRPIFFTVGLMVTLLGVSMVPCAVLDYIDFRALADGPPLVARTEDWAVFALSSFACTFFGGVLALAASGGAMKTGAREAFFLTVLVWVVLPLAASVPFLAFGMTFTDALFEAVSGLTTTGSTVVTGLDTQPRGFLLWRSILQWIGGVGIIVTAIAILPMLRVGGMQLFQLESSDVSGKFLPRVAEIATQISAIYVGLTVICALFYSGSGMPFFDSVNHAMTTMAAGGYSTKDLSLSHYAGTSAPWVSIVFMTLAGLPFGALVLMVMHGQPLALWRDPQPRVFIAVLLLSSLLALAYFALHNPAILETPHVVRNTLFNVISITTGTGYAVSDYGEWGGFIETLFLALMFVGGCAGSAACGIKVFRLDVTARAVLAYTQRTVRPNRVAPVRYGGRVVPDDTLQSVMIFLFLYFMTFTVSAVLLSVIGLDPLTAISGAATSVSNVGPGLGSTIGPTGTFQTLPDAAKWVCLTAMLLGRLEFVSVFVVLTPRFWRG